jgi:AcrR family transcriptional regulator
MEYTRVGSHKASAVAKVPTQERGRLRVIALLGAAEAIIAERGYEAATMTEIAAKAGASIGSLYQFFPTKEAVADALRTRLRDAFMADLDVLAQSAWSMTAEELAARLLGLLPGFFSRHPAFPAIAEARRLPRTSAASVRHGWRAAIARVLEAYAPDMPETQSAPAAAVVFELMKANAALSAEPGLRSRRPALDDMQAIVRNYLPAPSRAGRRQHDAAKKG